MWPSPLQSSGEHWCLFKRVQGTTNRLPTIITWIDKCRCGRVIQVQATASGIRKTWYDKDGKFERVTGDSTSQANVDSAKPQDSEQRIFESGDVKKAE